jgi:ribosomal protein S1
MASLHKVIGVLSVGLLLSLGLSTVARTEIFDRRQGGQKTGEKHMHQMGNQSTDGKIIQGEVTRVEGTDCFIKGQDDKEVRLHIDIITMKSRNIQPGERIEARVNDQNNVIAILTEPTVADRRNAKEPF